jgi:guanylate kinase
MNTNKAQNVNPTALQRGIFFVLVGPGGAGKDTIMNNIFAQNTQNPLFRLSRLITATTRPTREGEQNGIDYHFKTKDEFRQMIADNTLIEYQQVTSGNYYGIPRYSVDPIINSGGHVLGDVDVLGAKEVLAQYGNDAVIIFVTVGDEQSSIEERLDILRQRMTHRKDKPEAIQERLDRAEKLEFPFQKECQLIVYNADIEKATARLQAFIESQILERQKAVLSPV